MDSVHESVFMKVTVHVSLLKKDRAHCGVHILGTIEGFVFGVPLTNSKR